LKYKYNEKRAIGLSKKKDRLLSGLPPMNRSTLKRLEAYAVVAALVSILGPMPVNGDPLAKLEVPTGQALFHEYCSQCHGADGIGDGPMAKVLKTPPADLTTIKQRAQGAFPATRVVEIIRYGGSLPGHGAEGMPVWGKVFSEERGGGKFAAAYSRKAVIELKRYLESIQKP
jgi:mono/diheme cytochrome c family protein